jgi:inner membrane protein
LSPITHFLTGWALANTVPSLTARDRALITFAGVVPDIDGLGAIPEMMTRNSAHPLEWFSLYHHQMHTLAFSLLVTLAAFVLARRAWITGPLALISFHLHLFEDVLGGRGPDGYAWPIPYLKPFSDAWTISWSGQWGLNAWPNFAITIALLLVAFYLAWSRGYSPLEMVSGRADQAFVAALRKRFPRQASSASGVRPNS